MSGTTPSGSDATPPTFAGASSATAQSDTSIAIAWSAATDNVTASSQIIYLVYRAASAGGENYAAPSYTSAAGATSLVATGLLPSTKYYFVVRARDQAGNIDTNTKEVNATSLADTAAPTFAGASSATVQSASAITLAWAAATDDITASSQIVYLVYRATAVGGESYAAPSYTTAAGAISYAVTGLSPSTKYYFVVRARDQAGNIDTNTTEVNATTNAPSFASDIWPIFSTNCATAGCHSGVMPAEGLNLATASSAYSGLVSVLSQECTSTYRVAPGSPSASYIMWKLQGSGSCFSGSQMPKGAPPLAAATQSLIGSWIASGAPNN